MSFLAASTMEAFEACEATAPEASTWKPNRTAEKWLVAQIAAGEPANLETRFHLARERTVRARVIENLLLKPFNKGVSPNRGLAISCAIVIEPLRLRNADVARDISLERNLFLRSVNFGSTEFHQSLQLSRSHFLDDLVLNGTKVAHTLEIEGAEFDGAVDFTGCTTGTALISSGAHFAKSGPGKIVSFNSSRVGLSMFFGGAIFERPVNFANMDVGLNFQADHVTAPDLLTGLNFGHTRIRNLFSLKQADVGRLRLEGASVGEMVWEQVRVQHFSAPRLHVDGLATFDGVTFSRTMDIGNSVFTSLELLNVGVPLNRDNVRFDDVSYKTIRFASNDVSDRFHALFEWPKRVRYSSSTYEALINFLNDQGYPNEATRMAYLQREENLSRLSGFSWLRAFCLKWLVGHGKYPFRAAWWCLGVIAIGTVVFWKKNGMALKAGEPADSAYSPFWYSLGVFLPVVDLQMSKIWSPKAHRTIAPHYMRFQILLGWILVPLFAAGITGLVK